MYRLNRLNRMNYKDTTSYVGVSSLNANDFVSISNYVGSDGMYIPQQSLLELSVAPGSSAYFSTDPSFEQRTDNVRIDPPSQTPVRISYYGKHSNHKSHPSAVISPYVASNITIGAPIVISSKSASTTAPSVITPAAVAALTPASASTITPAAASTITPAAASMITPAVAAAIPAASVAAMPTSSVAALPTATKLSMINRGTLRMSSGHNRFSSTPVRGTNIALGSNYYTNPNRFYSY